MNDEHYLLASAYIDGELTATERAAAEADPDVMAVVEQLHGLRQAVSDVAPPTPSVRTAAIAAALGEYAPTTRPAAPRAATAAPSRVRFGRRPSAGGYLAIAAGVLAVGLLGVAVANLGTGSDDTSFDVALESEGDVDSRIGEDADDTFAAGDANDQLTTEMAAEDDGVDTSGTAAADTTEESAQIATADEPMGGSERPELEPGQILTTPEQLGSFGTELLELERAGTLGSTPNHACPIDGVLSRAEYQLADTVVPILVAVDEAASTVRAVDADTCEVVAEGPLYQP